MKKLLLFLFLFGILFVIKADNGLAAQTNCTSVTSSIGRVTMSVTIPSDGTYRVWSRMKAPDSSNNSFYLLIDDCARLVGNSSSIPTNTWTWVDYYNGSSSNKNDYNLSAGTYSVIIMGNEDGVGVDKLLMTQDLSCVPTGTSGDNCPVEVAASPTPGTPDTSPPIISNPRVTDVTDTFVNIRWELDEYASGVTELRELGSSSWFPGRNQSCCDYNYHIQAINDLKSNTTYEYRITSVDASGNESVSEICRFTTGGAAEQACDSTPPPAQCIKKKPLLLVVGESVKSTEPNADVQFEFSITNQNTNECDDAAFVIGNSFTPFTTDATWNFTDEDFILKSGQTVNKILTITPGNSLVGKTLTSDINTGEVGSGQFSNISVQTNVISSTSDQTILNFESVKLHGIGQGGDNTNPNATGNTNPVRTTRDITVILEDAQGNSLSPVDGNISYNSGSGVFSGVTTLPDSIPSGSYLVKIKSPQYLREQITGIISITKGSETILPTVSLSTGDMNDDNEINLLDYNILVDCYSDLLPAKNCDDNSKKTSADLSDDGAVNANDYNLFIRELSVAKGD